MAEFYTTGPDGETFASLGFGEPEISIPPAGAWVWKHFETLRSRMRTPVSGIDPIPPSEFEAYLRLFGIGMTSFEKKLLFEMDLAFVIQTRKTLAELSDLAIGREEARKAALKTLG